MQAADYLDFSHTQHAVLFEAGEPVWSALAKLAAYLQNHLQPAILGSVSAGATVGPQVFIGEGTVVEPGAVIKGPAWIGAKCQVRSGAYIREHVIAGNGCTLGNSCEFKNCLLFDGCEVPHFNYVGDAILGYKAHLGAGVILSNVRLDRGEVVVNSGGELHRTGLKKFSAVVGDGVEIGCNSVISPGALLGRRSVIYPCASFSGVLPSDSILKVRQQQQIIPRRSAG